MNQVELFYKLVVVDIVSKNIQAHRQSLSNELVSRAADATILKRRFRIMAQLADYESQIYKKIYNYTSDDMSDYVAATHLILQEIHNVTDRNG